MRVESFSTTNRTLMMNYWNEVPLDDVEAFVKPEDKYSPHQAYLRKFKAAEFTYPKDKYSGRGIVTCAGRKYLVGAYVCISMLRKLGCELPIQIWHLGEEEVTKSQRAIFDHLDVQFVDALEFLNVHPARILNGWESKPYAIILSPFQEVLFLDADNFPVQNPTFLFDSEPYKDKGSVFWSDACRQSKQRTTWEACLVPYRDEPEFESGQILVDKARCWKTLQICMHMNEHSDHYYKHFHGDKETFHMAWRLNKEDNAMPERLVEHRNDMFIQYDFDGNLLFQHGRKFHLDDNHAHRRSLPDFQYDQECLMFWAEYQAKMKYKPVDTTPIKEAIELVERLKQASEGTRVQPIELIARTKQASEGTKVQQIEPMRVEKYDKMKVADYIQDGGRYLIRFVHGWGDMLMFLPLYRALQKKFLKAHFDLVLGNGQEGMFGSVKDPDARKYDKEFHIPFWMSESSGTTKSEACCKNELGIKPFNRVSVLPHCNSPFVIVHFQGTALPGQVNCPENVVKQIWNEIKEAGKIPYECHFLHCNSNDENRRYSCVDASARDASKNATNLYNLIGMIEHSFAFVGVNSGPVWTALSIMPSRTMFLEKEYKLSDYTRIDVPRINVDHYEAGFVKAWLERL